MWLIGCVVGWLIDLLVGCLNGWMVVWLDDLRIRWFAG